MSISLPNSAAANAASVAATAAATTAAQAHFVASATALINAAIANGFFKVEPYMIDLVSADYVKTYFEAVGYTVTYPIIPVGPWNPCFAPAGFPEVFPTDWVNWSCVCSGCGGPVRIQISWGP